MELGNMIFGNSRGEVPIERGEGFEEEIYRLFKAYAPNRDNSWREYGEEFENEIFSVFPYYWGDCECDWGNKWGEMEEKFEEENPHKENCFHPRYEKEARMFCPPFGRADAYGELRDKHMIKWSKKNGLENAPNGMAVYCDCGKDEKWEQQVERFYKDNGEHPITCPVEKPNFHYKPTDFRLKWYKYPLRDSYANKNITLQEFRVMINKCIASIKINK